MAMSYGHSVPISILQTSKGGNPSICGRADVRRPPARLRKPDRPGPRSFPGGLLIGEGRLDKVTLSVERSHTSADFRVVLPWHDGLEPVSGSRLVSGGIGEARTKGGDRVCSDNQGRLA